MAEKESGRNNAPQGSGFFTQAAAIVLVVFIGLYLAVAAASMSARPMPPLHRNIRRGQRWPCAQGSVDRVARRGLHFTEKMDECGPGPMNDPSTSD